MLYTFSKQTREAFEDAMGLDLTQFYDELCSSKVQECLVTLLEIEHARGFEQGLNASKDDMDALLEEQYNAGYDDAMSEYTQSRDDAYNEGFGQALQAAQDAILHIGR